MKFAAARRGGWCVCVCVCVWQVSKIIGSAQLTFPAGRQVVWEGDVGDTLFVVVTGLLSCRVSDPARPGPLARPDPARPEI